MVYFEDKTNRKKKTAALLLYTQLEHDNIILQEQHHLLQVFGLFIILFFFFFFFFFLIQFYVPFKIISAHMRRTHQSVGGRKRENPEKNHLAHPQAELGLSHMWPVRGSNPHQTQLGWC